MNDNQFENHKQLRGWVADRLRADIHEGRIQPGEWLRQERIAQEYGVSQMPVREAFKELVAEGILEQYPYRGVRVVQLSAADVEDLYATRSFLEGRAARAAALNITDEELQELKNIHAQLTAFSDPAQANLYRPLNRRFHQAIANASHRPYLTRVLGQMWEIFPAMLWNILPLTAESSLPERIAPDWEEHTLIIQAIENHDPDLSEKLVKQHIEEAAEELLAAMQRQA